MAGLVALPPIERAIAALTYDYIARIDAESGETIAAGSQIPLLQRSIAQDLRQIERQMGIRPENGGLLSAIAQAIDDALTELEEARLALKAPGR